MTYDRFLANLNSRGMFRIHPSLDRIQKVLRAMGNPHRKFPSIHIAGTNGKGSVAAALESVLRSCGYRTGLYTSPHLMDLRERVKIDGESLVDGFAESAEDVLTAERRSQAPLTYFELLTAIAFHSFAQKHVDVAIVECGLGGLWDATNVMEKPLMSIITSIGLDHMEWLGDDERSIALQKAGIIRPKGVVISGVRGPGCPIVLRTAREKGATVEQLGDQFKADVLTSSWRSGRQIIRYQHQGEKSEDISFGLLGSHQVDNAALVMEALRQLKRKGWSIPAAKQERGLRTIHWPGRLQIIKIPHSATILFDGAHNPSAMKKLLESIHSSPFINSTKTFVFSAFKDKDYLTMGRMIGRMAQEVCLCPLGGTRGAAVRQLRLGYKGFKGNIHEFSSPQSALATAVELTPQNGLIVVTGSLALVGKVLNAELKETSHV